MEQHGTLEIGAWYALIALDDHDYTLAERASRAPLAEFIGEGEFVDEEGTTFAAANFDGFVKQA